MKNWINNLNKAQKAWIIFSTLAVVLLGVMSGDSWVNILIGGVGMFYVAVYGTGTTKWSFILGVAYVGLYTIICLQNRIMLDALQNIILIPIYIYSFFYWGKNHIKPKNLGAHKSGMVLASAVIVFSILYMLSQSLHGNYSTLDALNTTCTLYAMILGLYGISLNWALWTVNNIASALTFGLALATPTGSITVFAMKMIFLVNGLIGWRTFIKIGKQHADEKFVNHLKNAEIDSTTTPIPKVTLDDIKETVVAGIEMPAPRVVDYDEAHDKLIVEINPDIAQLVYDNDGYCPCAIEKTDDTLCMCKEFREAEEDIICHCGRYKKA